MILERNKILTLLENATIPQFKTIDEVKQFTKDNANRLFGLVDMYAAQPSKAMQMPKDAPKEKVDAAIDLYNSIWQSYYSLSHRCATPETKAWVDLARYSTSASQYAFLKKMGRETVVNRLGTNYKVSDLISHINDWKGVIQSSPMSADTKEKSLKVADTILSRLSKI